MPAPKGKRPDMIGNKYWTFRNKHGRDHKYTPEGLWDEAVQYFEWVEDNPLTEDYVHTYQGVAGHEPVKKMRAMTITGFCIFADIALQTFEEYKRQNDFNDIVTRIENIIRDYKFTGAAAELLNPNIIARELGLVEKKEYDHTTGGQPFAVKPYAFIPDEPTDPSPR